MLNQQRIKINFWLKNHTRVVRTGLLALGVTGLFLPLLPGVVFIVLGIKYQNK